MSIEVAIAGATGAVGQKAIRLLNKHPHFRIKELAASSKHVGKRYGEAVEWRETASLPEDIANIPLVAAEKITSPYILSALPAAAARELEPAWCQKGKHVFSNASAFRMQADVPLLIPEVNAAHLKLTERQKTNGKLVANPNCCVAFVCLALAPLLQLGEFEHISATTLQALSGAGYPGVSAWDLASNLIPHIANEEEKIETETRRILGSLDKTAPWGVTAQVHRVPVMHGHTIALQIQFKNPIELPAVFAAYREANVRHPGLYQIYQDPTRPQPARDITPEDYRAHIGKIKKGANPNMLALVVMGHNLVRGAAGASIKNLESFLGLGSLPCA
jgi:aspartate-semialdehyde dehydrogenase